MYACMQAFADLLDRLVLTPSRNGKLRLMVDYFSTAPDPDRGYALAAITGELNIPSVKPAMIRTLMDGRMDPELFALSYDYVGDLAETVSLVWPESRGANRPPPLSEIVETLSDVTRAEAMKLVTGWLDSLDATGRWAFLKLLTGGLRIGVSARLAKLALAQFGNKPITEIEEIWHGLAPPYDTLFTWLEDRAEKPAPDIAAPFRPVMLAHPLVPKADRDTPDAVNSTLITTDTFAAEWKYDGIRVQASAERGARRIYTRTGDDISHAFPDVVAAMGFEGTLDGELLVRNPQMETHPAFIRAYDVLLEGSQDLREQTFRERRKRLERFIPNIGTDRFDLSPLVPITTLAALDKARLDPPAPEIEGIMLKRWDSAYLAGRPKGFWYKWKRDPFLVDAVLMYAQRGHGKRSSFYSDFTFGVWRDEDGEDRLAPVGKAYFGFTDEELKQLDAFVRANTIDRFGPVRAVTANKETGIVLEVAFEGLQRSPRHKSGIAMRFPRINRIRWDKPTAEADRLETLEALLPA